MNWYEWFFDGIGTEIVSLILGVVIGSFVGYKIGIKRNSSQKQIAKDDSKQLQFYETTDNKSRDKETGIVGNVRQTQKARNNAEQKQIGR